MDKSQIQLGITQRPWQNILFMYSSSSLAFTALARLYSYGFRSNSIPCNLEPLYLLGHTYVMEHCQDHVQNGQQQALTGVMIVLSGTLAFERRQWCETAWGNCIQV